MKNARSRLGLALCLITGLTQMCTGAPVMSAVPGGIHADPWPPDVAIRLCAIRVEFPEDQITGTTGTGRMESWFSDVADTLIIDPLPHDKAYFEDHLAFLQHYYSTVSKGAVTFASLDVYPVTDSGSYTLSNPMWHYNYNSDDALLNQRLVELFVESTQLADLDIDYMNYDAIVIFHAGAGKDFNFGYDFTPFDIPSAYISDQDILTFDGPVPAGVSRGLILPEGENQQEALDLGVQLSLNGIMVKLFGNWLGMPDLFNTQTGQSGIGRWGMMDQGSGNLGALVPAMPDAWTRAFMRWQDVTVRPPTSVADSLRVSVARFNIDGAPEIVKLPVTPREYYLVENRDADDDSLGYVELFDRDGRVMHAMANGDLAIEANFRNAVSASHYDFGIPGSGLLIWHVDEDVIDARLTSNTVNADPGHRGVDLVEADAAQDIGEVYGFASPGSGAELGVPEDAWYAGNEAHRAANRGALQVRFTDGTYPSARLYDGAFTYYELTNFSPIDTVMSFRLLSTSVAPGFPIVFNASAEWGAADLDGDGLKELYVVSGDSLYRADSTGRTAIAAVPLGCRPSRLSSVDMDDDGRDELLLEGSVIGVLGNVEGVDSIRFALQSGAALPVRAADNTPLILAVDQTDPADRVIISLYDLHLTQLTTGVTIIEGSPANRVPLNIESFPAASFVFMREGEARAIQFTAVGFSDLWRIQDDRINSHGKVLAEPGRRSVFLDGYGYVDALNGDLLCAAPDCMTPGVDWDLDGIPDGGGLVGTSTLPREDAPQIGADTSWVIDLNVNGDADMIGLNGISGSSEVARYSRYVAVKHYGGLFAGFPMAVTGVEARRPFTWNSSNNLYFVSEVADSGQYFYSIVKLPILAPQGTRFPFEEEIAIINVGALRPQVHVREDWLYCWPNPAHQVSHIRFTSAYPATARVNIFDLSGRKVAELSGSSSIAGQFEILWDVSDIESGVYVGAVTMDAGGTTEHSEIKIAVVK